MQVATTDKTTNQWHNFFLTLFLLTQNMMEFEQCLGGWFGGLHCTHEVFLDTNSSMYSAMLLTLASFKASTHSKTFRACTSPVLLCSGGGILNTEFWETSFFLQTHHSRTTKYSIQESKERNFISLSQGRVTRFKRGFPESNRTLLLRPRKGAKIGKRRREQRDGSVLQSCHLTIINGKNFLLKLFKYILYVPYLYLFFFKKKSDEPKF